MSASVSCTPEELVSNDRSPGRVYVGCTPIDLCTFEEAVAAVISLARTKGQPRFVVTPNAQHSLLLEVNPDYRAVYERAWLSVPDGTSMAIGAWLLGHRLKERVPGVDLFEQVCAQAADKSLKILLLGGKPNSARHASAILKAKYPGLKIADYCPPMGFDKDECEMAKTDAVIRGFSPDIVFVGLGAPKQEFWMAEHANRLNIPVAIGVGGSFELISGVIPRAPKILRRCGLEWAYRLVQEPKRLWRRYVVGALAFSLVIFKHVIAEQSVR